MPRLHVARSWLASEDEPIPRAGRPASWWRAACAIAAWGLLGAGAGGGAWALGLAVSAVLNGVPFLHEPELQSALPLVGGSSLGGLVVGGVTGLLLGATRGWKALLAWGISGTAIGALGGGLCWSLITFTRGRQPPEVSSTVAWSFTGLVVAVAGSCWLQLRRSPVGDEREGQDLQRSFPHEGTLPWPDARLFPVLAVASACLVAFLTAPPSDAGWAVLGVGLLGLATAWTLAAQERRIRDLERQLRERQDRQE